MRLHSICEQRTTTVAVDLDGTLAKELPQYDPKKIGPPVHNARRIMTKLRDEGVTIIINTCRGNKQLVESWLEEHDIPFDHINENPDQPKDTSHKIMADRYWDNRQPHWRGLQNAFEELEEYLTQ